LFAKKRQPKIFIISLNFQFLNAFAKLQKATNKFVMACCVVTFTLITTSVLNSTDTEHGLLDAIGSVSATDSVCVL